MSLWLKIRVAYTLIRLGRSPNSFTYIEQLRAHLRKAGLFKVALDRVESFHENQLALKERWLFDKKILDLDRFEKLPIGTLGWAYADFLKKNGLDALFYNPVEVRTAEDYLILRTLQTHDLWHVVLGWSTSHEDEIRLQSFMLPQISAPQSGFIIAGYLLRLIFTQPTRFGEGIKAVSEGWQLGTIVPPLFGVHWEKMWEMSLSDVRRTLGVPAERRLPPSKAS